MNLYCNNEHFEIKDSISYRNYLSHHLVGEEEKEIHTIIKKIFSCQKKIEDLDEEYLFIPLNDYNLSKLEDFVNSQELLSYYSKKLKEYNIDKELHSKNSFISIEPIVEDEVIYFNYVIHFKLEEHVFMNPINKIKEIINQKNIVVEIWAKSLCLVTNFDNSEIIQKLLSANCNIKVLKNLISIKEGIYE